MTYYDPPFIKPQLLQKGVPAYFFGGLNMLRGNCSGTVADTTLASNVGSVTVQINEGPIPLVGDYITVWGTSQQTGLFNVTRALITAVAVTSATGAGTISYALTGSNQSIAADTGRFLCEIGETSEALANGFSSPICVQAPQGDSQFTLSTVVSFPSLPTAATINIQAAIRDLASEYTTLGAVATVAGGVQTAGPFASITLQRGSFYRLQVTGVSGGTNPTIVAKAV